MTPEKRRAGRRIRKARRPWVRLGRAAADAAKSMRKFGRVLQRAAEQIGSEGR